MKLIIYATSIILLVINVIACLILSSYGWFNFTITSVCIVVAAFLLILIDTVKLKDAFRFSLSFIVAFLLLITLVLGAICPNQLKDNWYLILIILILGFEIVLTLIAAFVTKKNDLIDERKVS